MKTIFIKLITALARSYLLKYKPTLVAITGNVGKTSAKEAIYQVLSQRFRTRQSEGNLNNELGVPLTIITGATREYYESGGTLWFWAKAVCAGLAGLIIPVNYPKVLILEFGADHPGDIAKLVANFKPDIGVVTGVGTIPVHVEFFKNPAALAEEKSQIISALTATSHAILNFDDPTVAQMQKKTFASVTGYGFSVEAQIKISDLVIALEDGERPSGIAFKLTVGESFLPIRINGSLGPSQALAAAAGAAVGKVMGLNLVQIGTALERYKGPVGRLKILDGIKASVIIDDTYNSSPAAAGMALETLKHIPAKRKIVVLGDMLELGEYSAQTHQDIGRLAAPVADILICVGDKSKLTAEAASGGLAKEKIHTFTNSNEAKIKVQEMIEARDVVLVKGSQGMRMEKIVEEIMAEPARKRELLVRQSQKWLAKF